MTRYKVRVGYLIEIDEEDAREALSAATMPMYGNKNIHSLSASVVHAEPLPTLAETPAPILDDIPF